MTKKEALTIAESAPEPTQSLLEEIIERVFVENKSSKKPRSKKITKPDAPEKG